MKVIIVFSFLIIAAIGRAQDSLKLKDLGGKLSGNSLSISNVAKPPQWTRFYLVMFNSDTALHSLEIPIQEIPKFLEVLHELLTKNGVHSILRNEKKNHEKSND